MFAVPSFFGYNTTFINVPVATAATGVGDTSFTANWDAFAGAQYYLLDVSISPSFSSFVLQDQVVYTNSYAVTGLTSNTTYYYRLRASTTYETDAEAFFTRVSSNGGSLTTTEQQAVNSLVIQMKADGIWTAMKAIYPMVGGGTGSTAAREAACAQNLKSASFTGTFTSGWTFASTGVTPNGSSAYMDTGFVADTNLTYGSACISYYSRTNTDGNITDFGSYGPPPITSYVIQCRNSNVGRAGTYDGGAVSDWGLLAVTDSRGFFIANRQSRTNNKMIRNNTSGVTNTLDSDRNYMTNNNNHYLAASNYNSTAIQFSNRECAFASIGDGLTDTQASNFYTAVQAFQTTLSRNV
jgi:hypothetical protein